MRKILKMKDMGLKLNDTGTVFKLSLLCRLNRIISFLLYKYFFFKVQIVAFKDNCPNLSKHLERDKGLK